MKATELRQGNLLEKNNEFHYVASIHADSTIRIYSEDKKDTYGCFALRIFNPIPLTKEWLVKFGFKKGVKGWFKTLDNNLKFNLYIYNRSLYLSVHQLQNLYFALTNEELTLNKTIEK